MSSAISKHFITATEPPASKLYHLSTNPDLGTEGLNKSKRRLIVRIPDSGHGQPLPARISFSPDPEACCYGAIYNFPMDIELDEEEYGGGRYRKRILYLYEGKPKKGETRYLKPSIVRQSVDAGEVSLSKEICVVSNIDIEFVSKVEVTWDSEKKLTSPGRFKIKKI